ncbi:MAG: hypothetical protein EBE86_019350 [Hormoscilla sp. GUM202]|nr:hypothetical protein [Hormoscilla sp. GUM202]
MGEGNAGNVTINSSELIEVDSAVPEANQRLANIISANAPNSTGNAGNIRITTE